MKRLLPLSPVLLGLLASGVTACGATWEQQNAEYQQCLADESRAVVASRTPAGSGPLTEVEAASTSDAVREKLKGDMRLSLLSSRASAVAGARCADKDPGPQSSGLFGSSSESTMAASDNGASRGAGGSSTGASQASGTNNQVAGVDEADFVKNDTKYIYVVNGTRFRIIEAWPAPNAHESGSVELPGTAKKLFVHGNRAVVYSTFAGGDPGASGNGYYGGNGECTYGYSCAFTGDGTNTAISIFDITDKSAPKLVRQINASSSLLAARRVGNAIHTVLTQWAYGGGNGYVWMQSSPRPSADASEADIHRAFDEAEVKNDAAIDALPINAITPTIEDSAGGNRAAHLFRSNGGFGAAFTSVVSLDLEAPQDLGVVSILSAPGAVYGSPEALYMSVPGNPLSRYYGNVGTDRSTVHKFAVGSTPLATSYRGSGDVEGHVLNQFSMDEKDGLLRVATTSGHSPDPAAHSTMTVLEERPGSGLAIIGQVGGIAKSEDIRSVRFDGDRGYIVTFKKTDPLYAFDLSNPRAPRIAGELKIPGFSTYMHMMDATHLLTIGYDATDQGGFAWFSGVLLQIFDVANPANPKLVHKETIGTRGTSSEALTNHLAFNYFGPKNLLALPMSICEGGDTNGGYGSTMTFTGLMVFDATVANGFKLRGKVAHPQSQSQSSSYYYGSGCYNWWTDASSEVKRSIVMDDFVFSVSSTLIKVNNIAALDQDVVVMSIE